MSETDWEQKYADLLDQVTGDGGTTCLRHGELSDAEWLRRHMKNAIARWQFWKRSYEVVAGKVPVTLEMRATNWEARAHWLERLCDEQGVDYKTAELAQVAAVMEKQFGSGRDGDR